MKTQIRTTKTKTYIRFNGVIFITNNNWEDKTITPVDYNSLQEQQKQVLDSENGWEEIGEYEDVQAAYCAYIGILSVRRNEAKIQNEIFTQKVNSEREAAWNAIKDLEVIPTTVDNIRTVLLHLNATNWGGWKLPKMSIGYSANQYDCDGVSATTIKLDTPISDEDGYIKNETMFKVGGKNGYLNKYQRL